MGEYKICVYAICKDEEQFVDRWVESMKEADLLVVCDTGSKDKTVIKLKEKGVSVYEIEVKPWRFDVPRNIALNLIPEDIDICICTDLDEVFEVGWREELEKTWQEGNHRMNYMFAWSYHSDGTPKQTFWKEKIHSRQGYRWIRPVHEALKYIGSGEEKVQYNKNIMLRHYPDLSKSRGQYLPLMEVAAKEFPKDTSIVFWLGREYTYYGHYEKAIETLSYHLGLSNQLWDQEKSASMRFIGQSYQSLGKSDEAKKWYMKAIIACPTVREPYVAMARLAYQLRDWPLLYYMCEEALKIKVKPISYLTEDNSWNETLYDLGAIACYQLGLYEKSADLARKAIEINAFDKRLENNLKLIEAKIEDYKKVSL